MDPLFALPIAAAAFGLAVRERRRRRRATLQAIRDCGLEVVKEWSFLGLRNGILTHLGGNEDVTVELDTVKGGLNVTVRGLERQQVARLALESLTARLRGAADLVVGDPAFDRALRVGGAPAEALAALDAPTRAAVLALLELPGRVSLRPDGFEVRLRWWPFDKGTRALGDIVQAASRLARPVDVERGLSHNVREDPLPGVRIANLRMLASEYGDTLVARGMLAHACDDHDEEVALAAALELGAPGRDTLLRLANNAEDDGTAASAIGALAGSLPHDQLLELFQAARRERRVRKAAACLDALAAPEGADAAAHVERKLIEALLDDEEGVPAAAARALGRLGSAAAVMPLRVAEEKGGAIRDAAEAAVSAIQSRLHGAVPGQVSLASGEAGQVSLSDDATGRVSIGKPE